MRGEWIVGYPGGLWAGPFPPKPYQKIILQGFPHFPKKTWAPLGPWWIPYCPFVGQWAYLPCLGSPLLSFGDQVPSTLEQWLHSPESLMFRQLDGRVPVAVAVDAQPKQLLGW